MPGLSTGFPRSWPICSSNSIGNSDHLSVCRYCSSLFSIRLFGRLSLPPTSTGNLRCWSAHRIIPHHLMGISPSAPLSRTLPTLCSAAVPRQSRLRVSPARPYTSNPGVSSHRLTCIALLATLLCRGPYLAGTRNTLFPAGINLIQTLNMLTQQVLGVFTRIMSGGTAYFAVSDSYRAWLSVLYRPLLQIRIAVLPEVRCWSLLDTPARAVLLPFFSGFGSGLKIRLRYHFPGCVPSVHDICDTRVQCACVWKVLDIVPWIQDLSRVPTRSGILLVMLAWFGRVRKPVGPPLQHRLPSAAHNNVSVCCAECRRCS